MSSSPNHIPLRTGVYLNDIDLCTAYLVAHHDAVIPFDLMTEILSGLLAEPLFDFPSIQRALQTHAVDLFKYAYAKCDPQVWERLTNPRNGLNVSTRYHGFNPISLLSQPARSYDTLVPLLTQAPPHHPKIHLQDDKENHITPHDDIAFLKAIITMPHDEYDHVSTFFQYLQPCSLVVSSAVSSAASPSLETYIDLIHLSIDHDQWEAFRWFAEHTLDVLLSCGRPRCEAICHHAISRLCPYDCDDVSQSPVDSKLAVNAFVATCRIINGMRVAFDLGNDDGSGRHAPQHGDVCVDGAECASTTRLHPIDYYSFLSTICTKGKRLQRLQGEARQVILTSAHYIITQHDFPINGHKEWMHIPHPLDEALSTRFNDLALLLVRHGASITHDMFHYFNQHQYPPQLLAHAVASGYVITPQMILQCIFHPSFYGYSNKELTGSAIHMNAMCLNGLITILKSEQYTTNEPFWTTLRQSLTSTPQSRNSFRSFLNEALLYGRVDMMSVFTHHGFTFPEDCGPGWVPTSSLVKSFLCKYFRDLPPKDQECVILANGVSGCIGPGMPDGALRLSVNVRKELFQLSVRDNQHALALLMIDSGFIDPAAFTSPSSFPPICLLDHIQDVAMARMLLNNGFDCNHHMYLSHTMDVDVVQYLIDQGTDPNMVCTEYDSRYLFVRDNDDSTYGNDDDSDGNTNTNTNTNTTTNNNNNNNDGDDSRRHTLLRQYLNAIKPVIKYHTPLYRALVYKKWPLVKLFVENKVDLNWIPQSGILPLIPFCIAAFNDVDKVAYLIDHGADIFHHDMHAEIALNVASILCNIDVIRLLLDMGASSSALKGLTKDELFGDHAVDVVDSHLDWEVLLNPFRRRDSPHLLLGAMLRTVRYHSAKHVPPSSILKDQAMMKIFIEKSNLYNVSHLIKACGHIPFTPLKHSDGSVAYGDNDCGITRLLSRGRDDVIHSLLLRGANLNFVINNVFSLTLVIQANTITDDARFRLVQSFLDAGVHVNPVDGGGGGSSCGDLPIIAAIKGRYWGIVALLLRHNANIDGNHYILHLFTSTLPNDLPEYVLCHLITLFKQAPSFREQLLLEKDDQGKTPADYVASSPHWFHLAHLFLPPCYSS